MEIQKYDLPTDGHLTWVGARDACASKKSFQVPNIVQSQGMSLLLSDITFHLHTPLVFFQFLISLPLVTYVANIVFYLVSNFWSFFGHFWKVTTYQRYKKSAIFAPLPVTTGKLKSLLRTCSLMRKKFCKVPILVRSRGMPLLLSGILFCIAL